jgi:hypothetical protein
MRPHFLFAALCLLTAANAPALAQTYPANAFIQHDVEVRSGPSKTFFATSKLKSGDRVIVIRDCKESPGWLEIKPPPGSFSWIRGNDVKQIDTRYAVVNNDAKVLPGSALVNQTPNREGIKLTAGTIVIIVDKVLKMGDEVWIPIQPNPSEVRYIPTDAVQPATQVAVQNSPPDWTRQQTAPPPGNTVTAQPTAFQRPAQPTTAFSPGPAPPGNLTTVAAAAWSKYGRLRATAIKDNGQPVYVLEDAPGHMISYVSIPPGKSLDQYIGKYMTVFGPTVSNPGAGYQLQYIVASHVAVPPTQ